MTTVVISQPMFFPWVGMFEQIRLADVYVHYDDVQFSKGSFSNRVQVKTEKGAHWLSVPLTGLRLGQRINEVCLDGTTGWRDRHLALLEQAYRRAPHRDEMLGLVHGVYGRASATLSELAMASMEAVVSYFDLAPGTAFHRSSELGVPGVSDDRVLSLVKRFGGARYVTGHGARNYLDHEMFEGAGVEVSYLDYQKTPYSQLHGAFTPFVSILDLIANEGVKGASYVVSPAVPWRSFLS
jgi:hypothetical protein